MKTKLTITLDDAASIMTAALSAARGSGASISIAIVDDAGVLIAFQRMPEARGYTAELAQQKARVSAQVGVPSAAIQAAGRSDATAGGVPIKTDGQIVGAIGVSGASTQVDVRIAEAGIAAWAG